MKSEIDNYDEYHYDFELEWIKRRRYKADELGGKGIISQGISRSESIEKLIERHTEIYTIYNVPPFNILRTPRVRHILANVGRKRNIRGRLYMKTAYRVIIMYSVQDGLFPAIFRCKLQDCVASIAEIDEKICRHGRSCVSQIEEKIGKFYSEEWVARYAQNCGKYLGVEPYWYYLIIKTSYETNEDEALVYKKIFKK